MFEREGDAVQVAGRGREANIQLLGGFSVNAHGVHLPEAQWKSRRASNLIKLLALVPGHRLHRDQVIDTFWPDSDLAAGVNSFHQTLYTARRVLGEAGKEWLLLKDDFLSLADFVSLDVDQFEAAAAKAAAANRDTADIQNALAWYKGDLLPEDLYEDWIIQRRESFRLAYLKLLLDLARLAEAQQNYPAGIEALRRLLAVDASHEEAHASLMRLYALDDQRQLALRQYQVLREALKTELDVEPSPATQALFQAIQSGRMVSDPVPVSPPIPTAVQNNLPVQLSSFIGREQEITELNWRVKSNRMVTLTGAGGMGKTRLALQVADGLLEDFPDGVFLVKLALLNDPQRVGQLVANELGIRDSQEGSYEKLLERYLHSRKLLLILDNCEHLMEACAGLVAQLLTHCPRLHILTTSREGLGIEGEALYTLQPMASPDPGQYPSLEVLQSYQAVQLFVNRAALVQPNITLTEKNAPAITHICWRLDGIPLAIELAAACANLLSIEQIAARLDNWFHLPVTNRRDALPHHQTMIACLDWSYNLLMEPERVLLRRLTVFQGGWTIEAAEEVCSDPSTETLSGCFLRSAEILDLLGRLVSRSMVMTVMGSEHSLAQDVRYRLLEPIRQYALAKLGQAGEEEMLRDRHLTYFMSLAEQKALKPFQNQWPRQWQLLKNEVENLRCALDWAVADSNSARVEDGLRIAGGLGDFWRQSGLYAEGRAWLKKLCDSPIEWGSDNLVIRARALGEFGHLTSFHHDLGTAKRLLLESVSLFREVGDPWRLARALVDLAIDSTPGNQVYPDEAQTIIDESVTLARQVGDPIVLAMALTCRGEIERSRGNTKNASRDWQESVDLLIVLGEGAYGGACSPLIGLGSLALDQGELAAAIRYRDDYLRYLPYIEDTALMINSAHFLMEIAYRQNDFDQMAATAQNLYNHSIGQGLWVPMYALRCLGVADKCLGKYRQAAERYLQSMVLSQEAGDIHGLYMDIAGLAGIAAAQGQPVQAVRLFGAVETFLEGIDRTLDLFEQYEFEKGVAIIREALMEEAYTQAWAEGRVMGIEEAFREAQAIAARSETGDFTLC